MRLIIKIDLNDSNYEESLANVVDALEALTNKLESPEEFKVDITKYSSGILNTDLYGEDKDVGFWYV